MKLLPLFLLATLTCTALAERTVVYVSNGGSASVSLFDLDATTGELKQRPDVALEGNSGPLAISPDRRFIYAALRTNKSVQTLRVQADGALAPAGASVPIEVNSAYLQVDSTGQNLLTADYGGDTVTVHRIDTNGTVSPAPASKHATGRNPHSIQADPANLFAFVPLCGADKVLQFKFDAKSGTLTPNAPADVAFQPVDGPRHFAFHPTKPFVYVVNEKSSSVTGLKYDAAAGTLTALETLPTIPATPELKNSCADIHVSPNGKFVYASNRGHDSIAGFAIDEATGKLKALGQTPTEKTPRSFALDAAGRYLFAAGQGSGQLATYRVDQGTGALTPLKTYATGKGPAWVLAVTFP